MQRILLALFCLVVLASVASAQWCRPSSYRYDPGFDAFVPTFAPPAYAPPAYYPPPSFGYGGWGAPAWGPRIGWGQPTMSPPQWGGPVEYSRRTIECDRWRGCRERGSIEGRTWQGGRYDYSYRQPWR